MTIAPDAKRRESTRRSLVAESGSALLVALFMFLLFDSLAPLMGVTPGSVTRASVTLVTLCVLCLFAVLQRIASSILAHDTDLVMPNDFNAQKIREFPQYYQIVIKQLRHVIAQTERAATDIATRLHAIDHAMNTRTLKSVEEETFIEPIDRSRRELAPILAEAIASVQFQDITRQQIEQIIQGIEIINAQGQRIADALATHDTSTIPSLRDEFSGLYAAYVMEQQREIYHQVLGDSDLPTQPIKSAHGKKVELF